MRWYLGKCLWFAKWKRLYNSSYTKDYDHITMWLPLDTNWYWIYKNENLYVEMWKYVCFLLLKNVLTLLYVSFTFLKRWLKSHKGPPEGPHPGVSSEHGCVRNGSSLPCLHEAGSTAEQTCGRLEFQGAETQESWPPPFWSQAHRHHSWGTRKTETWIRGSRTKTE